MRTQNHTLTTKLLAIICVFLLVNFKVFSDGVYIFGANTMESQDLRLDINFVSKEKMLASGIAISYVNKIVEYREITGGMEELEELKRISGIGQKTYEKLEKKFKIESRPRLKKLKINSASETVLKYFGITKAEFKKIEIFKKEYKVFKNNLDLKKVLSGKRYDELKDRINYDR